MAEEIRGNLASIAAAQQQAMATGESATAAGGDAAGFANEMEASVNDVTDMLRSRFASMADEMTSAINSHKSNLGATEWTGRAKQEADAAEAALHGDVSNVLNRSNEWVNEFKSTMLAQSTNFVEQVNGEFNNVMADIQNSYAELANAEGTFAANLQAADESVKFTAR